MKQKSIFECLNKLHTKGNILNGYVWSNITKAELEGLMLQDDSI